MGKVEMEGEGAVVLPNHQSAPSFHTGKLLSDER